MLKLLLALALGLLAFVPAFLAAELGGYGTALVVIAAYFLGSGYLIASGNPMRLGRYWPAILALNAPMLFAIPMVARGEGPEGVPPFASVLLAAWVAACAGAWLASRRTAPSPRVREALILVGVPLVALAGVALAAFATGRLREPGNIDGVPCDAGWITRHPGGRLRSCMLASGIAIQGTNVAAGTRIDLDISGRLSRVRLGRDATIANAWLPAGTTVGLKPGGRIQYVFLPRDMPIQGRLCRGGGHSYMTGFHPNGRLAVAWLKRDEVIQGVPCSAATFWRDVTGGANTRFRDTGSLEGCRIPGDVTVQGIPFRAGDQIRLDVQGRVIPAPGR